MILTSTDKDNLIRRLQEELFLAVLSCDWISGEALILARSTTPVLASSSPTYSYY
jgi:hypothetical protein